MTMPGNIEGIEREVLDIEASIARGRDDWHNRECRGRCLRALGRHEEAMADLRRSLKRSEPKSPISLLAKGRIHQLIGEHDEAAGCWRRAAEVGEAEGLDALGAGRIVEAYFLLGDDDRALDSMAKIEVQHPRDRAPLIADLARARRDRLPEVAEDVAAYFRKRIRGTREKVGTSNMISFHDWHEIATDLAAELHSSGEEH